MPGGKKSERGENIGKSVGRRGKRKEILGPGIFSIDPAVMLLLIQPKTSHNRQTD